MDSCLENTDNKSVILNQNVLLTSHPDPECGGRRDPGGGAIWPAINAHAQILAGRPYTGVSLIAPRGQTLLRELRVRVVLLFIATNDVTTSGLATSLPSYFGNRCTVDLATWLFCNVCRMVCKKSEQNAPWVAVVMAQTVDGPAAEVANKTAWRRLVKVFREEWLWTKRSQDPTLPGTTVQSLLTGVKTLLWPVEVTGNVRLHVSILKVVVMDMRRDK